MMFDTAIWWIGVVVMASGAVALVLFFVGAVIVLWAEYAPKLIFSRPKTDLFLTSYRKDVRTSEGERIKTHEDLRINRAFCLSWRHTWLFGLIVFMKDSPHDR